MAESNFSQRDQKHLWHPYTQHKTAKNHLAIVKGNGALLWDEHGNEYIDAIASWWVNPFGHANKTLADAIYKQLTTLEHVLFGGFTHAPAVTLSEELIKILPNNQQKLFFSDNGSTAVEVAIKMALQYFYNKGEKRYKIVAFENAFHGDTFAAMAASGISFFTEAFKNQLIDVIRIPVPVEGKEEECLRAFRQIAETQNPAAFIFEPLVQGAAGMVMYSPKALNALIGIAKKSGILTIADEVMTGFGRTGKNFAVDYLKEQPDMMCLSKALTGGTVPMAITTTTQKIFDAFLDDDVNKALFHGHTYTANPTGCAAALASLKMLQSDETQKSIQRINQAHLQFQQRLHNHPKVTSTRVMGVIFALDIKVKGKADYYGNLRNSLYNFFIKNGVILRPVGNTIYILPPYVISDLQLEKIYATVVSAIEKIA